MKKFLLLSAVGAATLAVPFSMAKTAPKPVPTFGGLAKGLKFTLPVTYRSSDAVVGTTGGTATTVPVPADIPKFNVGQSVTFVIGAKGELTGSGFKIPYVASSGNVSVSYATIPTRAKPQPNAGIVFNNALGSPDGVSLTFISFKIKKLVPTVTTVEYTFGSL